MLRAVAAFTMLAAPAASQGLDCVLESRCLAGEACKAPEAVRIEVRPAGDDYAFALVGGPGFTVRRETIGPMTRFTTDPMFDTFWSLTTAPDGQALASATALVGSLAAHHFVGRCGPA